MKLLNKEINLFNYFFTRSVLFLFNCTPNHLYFDDLRRFFLKIPFKYIRKFLSILSYILTRLNGFYAKLGLLFGNYYQYSFEFFFSQSQDINNKVSLDEKSVDVFGLKKVNISWNISLNDQNKYNKIINKTVYKIKHKLKNKIKNQKN